jgi:hypothetical protein
MILRRRDSKRFEINLAGICFDSSRFSTSVINMPGRKAEYDSLAFAVICVIFISLIFWIISLSTDIALVLSPQAVNSCLGRLGKARKGLVAQAQKSLKASKGSGFGGKRVSSPKKSLGDSDIDPNEVQFEQNVDLLKRNIRGGGEDDGMSMTDLRRLVIDLQSRLEDAENQSSGPKNVRSSTKKSFTPVHVEDMETQNPVQQQLQEPVNENPMKQGLKFSDISVARKSGIGGRLKGKVTMKQEESEVSVEESSLLNGEQQVQVRTKDQDEV